MLAVPRSRRWVKVAAWHAIRLTRDPRDTGELIRVGAAGGHRVETPAGGSCDLPAANGRKRFRDDADDAACEVGHGREPVLAARAEGAADGRRPGGQRPSGWELGKNPADAGGTPVPDDDGHPVNGIVPLRPGEADALARPAVTYPTAPRSAASRGTGTPWASSPRPGSRGAEAKPGGCCAGPGPRV
jgi:hypothetical protein